MRRDRHPLAPAPIAVGTAITDATGGFSLTADALQPGRYHLRATYQGNPALWPASAEADALVP